MGPDDRAALEGTAAAHRDQIATLETLIDPSYAPPVAEGTAVRIAGDSAAVVGE